MNDCALTDNELEVIKLLISGLSNKQVCLSLHISRSTLEHRLQNIMGKTESHTIIQAVAVVVRKGWV